MSNLPVIGNSYYDELSGETGYCVAYTQYPTHVEAVLVFVGNPAQISVPTSRLIDAKTAHNTPAQTAPEAPAPAQTAPAQTAPAQTAPAQTAPATPIISMEDFRQQAKQLRDKIAATNGGSPDKAVAVLQGMGVKSLADVPEDQRGAVLDALRVAAES